MFANFALIGTIYSVSFPDLFKNYKSFVYGLPATNAVNLVEKRVAEDNAIRQEFKSKIESQCIFRFSTWSQNELNRLKICRDIYGKGTAIFGDSHANDLFLWLALQNKSDFIVSFSNSGCRLEVNPPSRCINTSKFNILQDYLDNFEISYFEESGIYMFLLNGQKTDRNLIGFSQ